MTLRRTGRRRTEDRGTGNSRTLCRDREQETTRTGRRRTEGRGTGNSRVGHFAGTGSRKPQGQGAGGQRIGGQVTVVYE